MRFVTFKQARRKYSEAFAIVLILALTSVPASAQTAKKADAHFVRNAVYVEALGVGVLYSINYDRRITREFDLRVGFMTIPPFNGFPVMLNYLAGSHGHYLEIGVGTVIWFGYSDGQPFFSSYMGPLPNTLAATIGYRYQPDSAGYIFRIDFTPILIGGMVMPTVGISVGRTFQGMNAGLDRLVSKVMEIRK